jgi:hypothetical protein
MSDFSGLEQSFAVPAMSPMSTGVDFVRFEAPPAPADLQAEDIDFIRLRGPRDIARVQHLRRQIALPASAVGDPGFASREKKETSWVS